MIQTPPPVLLMNRVIAYAVVDDTVKFTGRWHVRVEGKALGRVPRLAIGQPLEEAFTDTLLHHCDESWNVLGTSGKPTLEETLAHAERAYEGVGTKWIYVNTSVEDARNWIRRNHPLEICSFCGRFSYETKTLITQNSSVICSTCIDEFHDAIHDKSRGS